MIQVKVRGRKATASGLISLPTGNNNTINVSFDVLPTDTDWLGAWRVAIFSCITPRGRRYAVPAVINESGIATIPGVILAVTGSKVFAGLRGKFDDNTEITSNLASLGETIPGAGGAELDETLVNLDEEITDAYIQFFEAIKDGKSAYEIAVDYGYEGTEEEFAVALTQPDYSAARNKPSIAGITLEGDVSFPFLKTRSEVAISPIESNAYQKIQNAIDGGKTPICYVQHNYASIRCELVRSIVPSGWGTRSHIFVGYNFSDENQVSFIQATIKDNGSVETKVITSPKTVYESAVENGYTGTLQEFTNMLIGFGALINGKIDKPEVTGTNGQVLTSDGAGGQAWQTPTTYPMNFEHIISFTTSENVRAVVIDKDKNGNSFKLDRMIIIATIPTLGVSTGYGMPKVNGKGWSYLPPSSGWDNATFSVEIQNFGSHIIAKFLKHTNNGGSNHVQAYFKNSAFDKGIVSFTWQNFNGDAEHYITAGAKFDVWGIKK